MRRPTLSCPFASYTGGMKIVCSRLGENSYCGHQYFKRCKGWWALSEAAGRCPVRCLPEEEKR